MTFTMLGWGVLALLLWHSFDQAYQTKLEVLELGVAEFICMQSHYIKVAQGDIFMEQKM